MSQITEIEIYDSADWTLLPLLLDDLFHPVESPRQCVAINSKCWCVAYFMPLSGYHIINMRLEYIIIYPSTSMALDVPYIQSTKTERLSGLMGL